MQVWHDDKRQRWFLVLDTRALPAGSTRIHAAGEGTVQFVCPKALRRFEVSPAYARRVLQNRVRKSLLAQRSPIMRLKGLVPNHSPQTWP